MRPRNEQLRVRALEVVTDLVVEEGFSSVSTVRVAKIVGTSQSNLYSYFRNKDELLREVFVWHQQRMVAELRPLLERQLPAARQIEIMVRGMVDFGRTAPRSIRTIVAFRQQPELRELLPAIEESDFFSALFELLRRYQADGSVKLVDAEFMAEAVLSIVFNYIVAYETSGMGTSRVSADDVVKLISGFLLEES